MGNGRRPMDHMPGGVNSPVRSMAGAGLESAPLLIAHGQGPYLHDTSGNRYVDYIHGWGSIIAGHAHPAVVDAVARAARDGLGFGLSTILEHEYAEQLCDRAGIEMVRAVNSGTEAAMTAVRIARGFTGRDLLVKFVGGYHGHASDFLIEAGSGGMTLGKPSSAGVPVSAAANTLALPYNDAASVRDEFSQRGDKIAAVVVEPVAGNMNFVMPTQEFMTALSDCCREHGALLIADEVMTGLRACNGLAIRELHGLEPDLVCLGKVIGGGLPAAACGGRRELMTQLAPVGPVYQAGTLAGNPVALTAGLATLRLLDDEAYDRLGHTASSVASILQEEAERAGVVFCAQSAGGMGGFYFADRLPQNIADVKACSLERFHAFYKAMLDNGVLLPPSMYEAFFVGLAHDAAALEATRAAARAAFGALN